MIKLDSKNGFKKLAKLSSRRYKKYMRKFRGTVVLDFTPKGKSKSINKVKKLVFIKD